MSNTVSSARENTCEELEYSVKMAEVEENKSTKSTEEHEDNASVPTPQSTFKCVIVTFKPLFIFENLLGIFRISIKDNDFVSIRRSQKVFGLLFAASTITLFCYKVDIPQSITETQGLVDMVEEIPSCIALVQYIAAIVSTLFFLNKPTVQIVSNLVQIDTTLHINLNEEFYTKCRARTTQFILVFVGVHIIFALADILTDDEFDPTKLLGIAMYLIQDLEIFAFCKMVVVLKNRLLIVNEYVEKFVCEKDINKTPIFIVNEKENESDKKINFIGRISPTNMKIRDLATTYDIIGNTCYLINQVFKFQIFMNLVFTFVFVLITIWTSLYYFRGEHSTTFPENWYGPLATAMSWCLLTVISVAVMAYTCESLLTARNNTKILVNEIIMDYDLPKTMRVQAKVFMELIEAWPLRIFVYDMFSVDIKLMLKFVSVATTYLIVIIQISHFV